jgi:serine/threonine-protein kinase
MLAGEPPHTGPTVQAIISRVLTGRVEPVSRVRPSVPEHVDKAVQVALEKLPADRFQSAREFSGALTGEHPVAVPSVLRGERGTLPIASAWRAVRSQVAALALIFILFGVGVGRLVFGLGGEGTAPAQIRRYTIPHPPGSGLDFAISPDGNNLLMQKEGKLHIRPLDQFESHPLEGTEGGVDPFFSHNGQWVGFVQDWVLKKVPVEGGPVEEITDLPLGWLFGAHWAESGDIVYSWVGGVRKVSQAGGEPEIITELDASAEHAHYWPQLLDQGRLLLFTAGGPSGLWEDHSVVLLDLETNLRQVIAEEAGSGWYVDTGHILYSLRDGTLYALPFDLESRQATGDAFAVESGIRTSQRGGAGFRVSKSGTAAFFRGSAWEASRMVTVNRNGEPTEFGNPLEAYHFNYSPDGDQVALTIIDADNADLFLLDPAREGDLDRLTFDPIYDETPVWSPDGSRMAFSSEWYGGVSRVHVKPVDSAAPPQELFTGTSHIHLSSWSPDGRWLAFSQYEPFRRQDLMVVDVDSVENVITMLATSADEVSGRFSPDGHWMAYQTDESGTPEVFVMPFPPTGGQHQVSIGGGGGPRWAWETNELFFWKGDTMMVSRVSTEDQFRRETPRPLFVFPGRIGNYNVSPDGQQFIGKVPNPSGRPQKIHVVLNWVELLRNTNR